MPLTSTDLDAHQLWPTIEGARRKLNAALSSASGDEVQLIGDWQQALLFTERLKEIEPWRFASSGQVLESLRAQVEALTKEIQPLLDDPEADILAALQARMDAYSGQLSQAPLVAVTSGHLSGVTSSVAKFNEAIAASMESVSEKADSTAKEISDSYSELKDSLESTKKDLAKQKERVDSAITDHADRFASNLSDWSTEVETVTRDAAKEAELQRSAARKASENQIAELTSLVEQSQNMVNVIARNTVSTGYAQYALRQGIAATLWSLGAVSVALGGLIAMFLIVRDLAEFTVAESIFKATLSAALLATAALIGREASGHRREARDAKRTQLDLNTLEPFLANIGEDDARDLRRRLALRIFNRPMANSESGPVADDEGSAPINTATAI